MQQNPTSPTAEAQALRPPIKALVDQRRIREAMDLCREGRAGHPRDPWLATMQAYLHMCLGQAEPAGAGAIEAIQLGSQDPTAVLVLGLSHRNLGRHAEAADTLLAAHGLLPNNVDLAGALIEETARAYGMDRARALYVDISAKLTDRKVATTWALISFRAGLDDDLPPGFLSLEAMSVPAWMERAGGTLDFVGVREVIPIEDPVTIGGPQTTPVKLEVDGYVPYVATLKDATIFAKSNLVVMPGGVALNDTVADERFGRFVSFQYDEAALDQRDGRVLLDVSRHQVAELDTGIMLSGSASEHFGHWIPEYLAKLNYLQHHPRFAELPLIVDSGMPPQHLEYLRLLAANPIVQIPAGGALRCKQLIVASPSTYFPVEMTADHQVPPENQGGLSPGCMAFIRRRVLENAPPPATGGRKLYLSRQGRPGRRPLNEAEISAALSARGFEIVFAENMSFLDQVRMFQSAKIIVAPNGSSLMNVMFAPTGTAVFALSQPALYNWGAYNGLMRQMGYRVTFVCGDDEPTRKHASYRIPVDRLTAAVESAGG